MEHFTSEVVLHVECKIGHLAKQLFQLRVCCNSDPATIDTPGMIDDNLF